MPLCFADFEFTCGGRIVRDEVELLSIGLVISDDDAKNVIDTFYDTVLPLRHPRLTKQCIKLTGLSQGTIDASFDAEYICDKALSFLEKYGCERIFVWGNYDTVGLSSTAGIFENYALDCDSITRVRSLVTDIQRDVMKRFGTDDIINVKDLSAALDFEPDGSFHNALVDAQALYCIYSHSLRPDEGCEKVYKLLNDRLELKKTRELEQKQAHEQQIKDMLESMSIAERELYSSLLTDGRKRDAVLLVKLHTAIEKQYSKLPENCEIIAVSRKDSRRVSLFDKSSFVPNGSSELTLKSYPYSDKERLILESFEAGRRKPRRPARKGRRSKANIRNKG